MKEDDCDQYPCPCFRKTKCQLAGFEKVVELKNAGLAIYRHASHFENERVKSPRRVTGLQEENVFIFHNTKDADIQSADFIPEMEKRAIKCPRCRRIMDHALNILQKVQAICKNDAIGICDHCKLKQQPCCECVGAIKKFFDVKKDVKEKVLSKKRLGDFLSKVQDEFKGYFADRKRGRTEILKDYDEDEKKGPVRAKSDENIDQLCRWKYVRGARELNIKDLYRESERRGFLKPSATEATKKHIAFKIDEKLIIYEPSTSMFSIERKVKSAFLKSKLMHEEGYIKPTVSKIDEDETLLTKDETIDDKKSGLDSFKPRHYELDKEKPVKIYDEQKEEKNAIASEQKKLDEPDDSKEKDYFKLIEKKSGIKKDFVFSFPRDVKDIHEDKHQISSTELIHDVHDKIREKHEEKKRLEEEMRRKKIEEEERKLAALREKEIADKERARQEKLEEEMRLQKPDYRDYGKGQTKATASKESKSVPEMRDSTKGAISESKLKSKSAISKESKPEESRAEGKEPRGPKSKAGIAGRGETKPKGDMRDESRLPKSETKKPRDESKSPKEELKPPKGEPKPPKDQLKSPKGELKPPKSEPKPPKGEPKPPKSEPIPPKGEPKPPKGEPKPPKSEPKPPKGEPKPPKTEPKPPKSEPKPPKGEPKPPKSEPKLPKEEPKLPKGELKPPKSEPKPPKSEPKPPKSEPKPPKTEPKPPKGEPKGDSKEPRSESKRDSKQKGESKVTKGETKREPKPPKIETKGESKQLKLESKEPKSETNGDRKQAGDAKETKAAKLDKDLKPDQKDTKKTKGELKEGKGDSKEAKPETKESPETKLDWKKFVGTPKPPKPPPAKESKPEKEAKSDSKEPKSESKEPKLEKKDTKADSKEPKSERTELKSGKKDTKAGTKEPIDESKSQKGDTKTDGKAKDRVPKTSPRSQREAAELEKDQKEKEELEVDMKKIEKDLEKQKVEKMLPPKIEEEPMIKYGKDIKLRSPDEKRVPRRQIEAPPPPPVKKEKKELKVKQIRMLQPSQNLLALQMVKVGGKMKERTLSQLMTQSEIFQHLDDHKAMKITNCLMCIHSNLELEYESRQKQKAEMIEIIDGRNIKAVADFGRDKDQEEVKPLLFEIKYDDQFKAQIIQAAQIKQTKQYDTTPEKTKQYDTADKPAKTLPEDEAKGVIKYALSDRSFIEKGWTKLPTEKVVRKMNVYRMRPAHPEFDWFKRNKNKRLMTYDTGEKLAEFDDDGRGRWYYKNHRLALQYYDAEELNAQQRFVVFSNGEPDERGRARPYTILATFDYLGNGVVFDHGGKIRLKYNQTEGVVLDRSIGPASHWKWHTLNDPPVLQQVMIDTQMTHKDPEILKMAGIHDNPVRPDNEDMLAIEFDNFIKEKSKKLNQSFKPFQIKMKAMKINENFSLKVLDQANVYLIFRDGTTNIKLNLGMLLDHKEIVDTDTAEVGEVSNNMERFPAKTDSLAAMQKSVAYARHFERCRTERERRLRPPEPSASADKLTAGTSKPLKPPLCAAYSSASTTNTSPSKKWHKTKSRKPSSSNVYYDSRLL